MHLKVFLKQEKTLKLSLLGKYNVYKKNQNTQKNPTKKNKKKTTELVFFLNPGFFQPWRPGRAGAGPAGGAGRHRLARRHPQLPAARPARRRRPDARSHPAGGGRPRSVPHADRTVPEGRADCARPAEGNDQLHPLYNAVHLGHDQQAAQRRQICRRAGLRCDVAGGVCCARQAAASRAVLPAARGAGRVAAIARHAA